MVMPSAHNRIAAQSRRSRYSSGVPSAIAWAAGPCASVGTRLPNEHDVTARSEPLGSAHHPSRLGPVRVVLLRRSGRPGAEDPERPLGKCARVLAQEPPRLAAPAPHVDRAAQDDRVVGFERSDLVRRDAPDRKPRLSQHVGDRRGDLTGRAVFGGVRNENGHDIKGCAARRVRHRGEPAGRAWRTADVRRRARRSCAGWAR